MGLFDKVMSSVNGTVSTPYVAGQEMVLKHEWMQDRRIELKNPAPESLDELKAAVAATRSCAPRSGRRSAPTRASRSAPRIYRESLAQRYWKPSRT